MAANDWAIVVGINQYEFLPPVDHLKYAVNDAVRMRQFLCEQAKFPQENVLLCCDSAPGVTPTQRPSRNGLRHLLKNEIQRAQGANNFWFFYAGHGIVHEHQDFLLPCDGNRYDLRDTAIPISFVIDCLRDCGAHNVVLVLDMCRNRTRGEDEGSRGIGEEMGEETQQIAKERGIVTLFSCSRGERSYEIGDLEQGAFTYALLEGLKQSTTPRALEEYLRSQLPALNRQYGKPIQVPMVIPEPGWKYDRPLLLSCATPADIQQLAVEARDAELEEQDYEKAKVLWWQVIETDRSTPSDRAKARKAIERINNRINNSTAVAIEQRRAEEERRKEEAERQRELERQQKLEQQRQEQLKQEAAAKQRQTEEQERQRKYQEQKEAQNTSIDFGKGITLEMVKIPGGSFLMGSTDGGDDEKPHHKVTIKPFYMGKYPVTQEQWRAIANRSDLKIKQDLDPNPARFKDKPDSNRRPVETVNWQDAIEFCGRLSKLTGPDYRLPSEAEWEYACRAGTTTAYSFGKEINEKLVNYGNNIGETTSVGKYPANQFGLYDMHGNIWEWCLDPWHDNYKGAPIDGSVWDKGNETRYQDISKNLDVLLRDNRAHVIRGGSWIVNPGNCRSAYRLNFVNRSSNDGFRVVCAPQDL